ncbi:outer membrane beta-barrel family protein [Limibacter armeniacum]|uniref:outer membrane beta-barrel family protein n=1 Tax=Limibacter armeniacum TaxID=466084 RepID=UPI002FE616F0
MKKLLPILLLFFTLNAIANGDPNNAKKFGTVSGNVVEQGSSTPVGYATVALMQEGKSVTGALTKDDGTFEISKIPLGDYNLVVKFIGYQEFSKAVSFTSENHTLKLENITLSLSDKVLDEVTVQGEKVNVEYKLGKKIVNMSEELVKGSTSVSDALGKVPEINVDASGNISLRGDRNVRVLIDGKPTQGNVADVLQSLPPDAVENVEVITNPSAKYDPDGLSGIINIVTKKNKMEGMNGSVNVGAGVRDKYNVNGNLNVKKGKLNVGLSGAYRNDRYYNKGNFTRSYLNSGEKLDQQYNEISNPNFGYFKLNADYYIDSTKVLSAFINGNKWNYKQQNFFGYDYRNDQGEYLFSQNGIGRLASDGRNIGMDINYRQDLKKGSLELDFYANDGANEFYSNSEVNGETAEQSYTSGNTMKAAWNVYVGEVNFTHELTEKLKLEAGYKGEIIDASSENVLSLNETQTSLIFPFQSQLHAGYMTLSTELKGIEMKLGLRAEHANMSSDSTLIDYSSLFPTLHLQKKLGEMNSLSLSYSRRVRRPEIDWILPIEVQTDPQNIRVGNQGLQPSYTNSIELGLNHNAKNYSLNASIYTRLSNDVIRQITTFDEDRNVNISQFQNIGKTTNYGISLSSDVTITDWWKVNGGIDLFHFDIDEDQFPLPNRTLFNWNGKLNTTFTLPKELTLTVNGNYSGKQYGAQDINLAAYNLEASVTKKLFNKKADLTLSANHLAFNGERTEIYYDGFTQYNETLWENPVYRMSFTYRFGKMKMKNRERSTGNGGGFM